MKEIIEIIKDTNPSEKKLLPLGGGNQPKLIGDNTTIIDAKKLSGVIDYQPEELCIRVYAGTPIKEVNEALAKHHQFLANLPPVLSDTSSIGGMVAGNLSSWSRLGYGAARDQILGLGFINGRGEYLEFGGQVMKNVAGFDTSRLMAGSQGAFGVIHDVSLKVLPYPKDNHTFLINEADVGKALTFANDCQRQPISIIGAAYYNDELFIKISGSEKACELAQNVIGGKQVDDAPIWRQLETYTHPIFDDNQALWRISCDPLATFDLAGEVLFDWAGGLRFLKSEESDDAVLLAVSERGASAKKWQGINSGVQSLVPSINQKYIKRLKSAFDPQNLFDASNLPCI